jgi:Uma2 family endonuclease
MDVTAEPTSQGHVRSEPELGAEARGIEPSLGGPDTRPPLRPTAPVQNPHVSLDRMEPRGNGSGMAIGPDPSPRTAYEIDEPDVSALVTEDDTPVDGILSEKQQRLLTEPIYSSWSGPPRREGEEARSFAVLANVGLFTSPDEPPVAPDVMLSLDVTIPEDLREKKNRSYFIWRYGKPPDVVIEIVSNREGDELGERLWRYQRMHVSYYVVYDPLRQLGGPTLRAFELRGNLYVPIERMWFESIGIGLIEWEGVFEGVRGVWLRWCTRDGKVVPTGAERAESAEARVKRAEARLRELGIDPDDEGWND